MRRTLLIAFGLIFAVLLAAMFRQHQFYDGIRRHHAQDHQTTFYRGKAFHVLTLLKSKSGNPSAKDSIAEVSGFKRATESLDDNQSTITVPILYLL